MKSNPNIVFCTHTSRDYMPVAELSSRQVVVGPNVETRRSAMGRVMSINTPVSFDLAAVVDTLPADQKPDLIVSLVDSFLLCTPRNLGAISCRKVLYFADSHHGVRPLCRNFAYAETERYDRYAIAHTPHHLHWFLESGLAPVAVHLNLNARDFARPNFAKPRHPRVAFVGQQGKLHVFRRRALRHLEECGLPIDARRLQMPEAVQFYTSSQLVLNTSNGDFNMRFFEVLSAGGCLLTDRLHVASRANEHLVEGEHYIAYGDELEMADKARYYLDRPEECLAIARRGHAAYNQFYAEKIRKKKFLQYCFADDETAREMAAQDKPMDTRIALSSPQRRENLPLRVMLYEQMQELQRAAATQKVWLSPSLPDYHDSDLADLIRLPSERGALPQAKHAAVLRTDELQQFLSNQITAETDFLYLVEASPPPPHLATMLQQHNFIPLNGTVFRYPGAFMRKDTVKIEGDFMTEASTV